MDYTVAMMRALLAALIIILGLTIACGETEETIEDCRKRLDEVGRAAYDLREITGRTTDAIDDYLRLALKAVHCTVELPTVTPR